MFTSAKLDTLWQVYTFSMNDHLQENYCVHTLYFGFERFSQSNACLPYRKPWQFCNSSSRKIFKDVNFTLAWNDSPNHIPVFYGKILTLPYEYPTTFSSFLKESWGPYLTKSWEADVPHPPVAMPTSRASKNWVHESMRLSPGKMFETTPFRLLENIPLVKFNLYYWKKNRANKKFFQESFEE